MGHRYDSTFNLKKKLTGFVKQNLHDSPLSEQDFFFLFKGT